MLKGLFQKGSETEKAQGSHGRRGHSPCGREGGAFVINNHYGEGHLTA